LSGANGGRKKEKKGRKGCPRLARIEEGKKKALLLHNKGGKKRKKAACLPALFSKAAEKRRKRGKEAGRVSVSAAYTLFTPVAIAL